MSLGPDAREYINFDLPPDPSFSVADIVGYTEGWRSWEVAGEVPKFGTLPKLFSVAGTHDFCWAPRRESRAHCDRQHPCETIPGTNHGCGFYSAKDPSHLLSMAYHHYDGERDGCYRCIGKVANWGNVVQGTLGWRAEYCYPLEIYVPYEIWRLVEPLEEAYGVPVRLLNFLKPAHQVSL